MSNIIQEMTDEEFLDQFPEYLTRMNTSEQPGAADEEELPNRSSLDPLI